MLEAHEVYVVDVQKVGCAEIRLYVLLSQFEAYTARIRVARRSVVYRYSYAGYLTVLGRNSLT